MKNILTAAIVGFVFAIGLGIAGMTQPQKVIAFLDVFGAWDPSLMFVMAGAIAVHYVTYRLIRRRATPLFSTEWHVPEKTKITRSLAVGSVLFGIGWGLAGYCPGPALTSLATGDARPLILVATMLLGMFIFKIVDKKLKFDR